MAVVPNLVGLSLEEATRLARAAGFEVVPLRVGGHPPGQVVSQDVPAGRREPFGSPIGIRVGK
jgi:beta-lactam-binding protein with PASTA domain